MLAKAVRVVQNDSNNIQYLEASLIKFKNHYMKSYSTFKNHLDMLMKENNTEIYHTTSNQYSGDSLKLNKDDDLNRLTTLEEGVSCLKSSLSDLENSLRSEGTMADLEKLRSRVREIESRVSGDSCSINHGEYVFTSETEVGVWLKDEDVPSLGMFWDVFSVFVAMAPKRLSGKERADQQYSSGRIQTTTTENEPAALMAYERHQTLNQRQPNT
jgi:hypothetical protein